MIKEIKEMENLLLACGINPSSHIEVQNFFQSIDIQLRMMYLDDSVRKMVNSNLYHAPELLLTWYEKPGILIDNINRSIFILPCEHEKSFFNLCLVDSDSEQLKNKLSTKMKLGAFL